MSVMVLNSWTSFILTEKIMPNIAPYLTQGNKIGRDVFKLFS